MTLLIDDIWHQDTTFFISYNMTGFIHDVWPQAKTLLSQNTMFDSIYEKAAWHQMLSNVVARQPSIL